MAQAYPQAATRAPLTLAGARLRASRDARTGSCALSRRFTLQGEFVCGMYDAVEARIGEGGVAEIGVPMRYRQLTGDQPRACAHAVFEQRKNGRT